MGVFFTDHIYQRMRERGISKRAIDFIVKNFDNKYEKNNSLYIEGVYQHKTLRVVAIPRKNHLTIVTAYYL